MWQSLFKAMASWRLAVALWIFAASSLAAASLVELRWGPDVARFHVYESWLPVMLLGMLVGQGACAVVAGWPWRLREAGFPLVQVGLALLLMGAVLTRLGGLHGQISLAEGETTGHIVLPDQGQLNAFWVGKAKEAPFEFPVALPPQDWSSSSPLKLGRIDGLGASVAQCVVTPVLVETWVADTTQIGGPALKFRVTGADGKQVSQGWLVDQRYGDAVFVGPLRLQLDRAVNDRMLDDFHKPPVDDLNDHGILAAYCGEEVAHWHVNPPLGGRHTFQHSGISVEIASYLPNAVPDRMGQFVSKGSEPKNPMVELRVLVPAEKQPLRQIAFAKDPLLNLDGVYARDCPVKFRYFHPAVMPAAACELLQTSDGTLHGRVWREGRCESLGQVDKQSVLSLPGGYQLMVDELLPFARRKAGYVARENATLETTPDSGEPAMRFVLDVHGETHEAWLKRNDPVGGRQTLATRHGDLAVEFVSGRVPLDATLELVAVEHEPNPGNVGDSSIHSRLILKRFQDDPGQELQVSVGRPARVGRYRILQGTYGDAGHDRERSEFTASFDPGSIPRQAGCGLMAVGVAWVALFWRRREATCSNTKVVGGDPDSLELEPQPKDVGMIPTRRVITVTRRAAMFIIWLSLATVASDEECLGAPPRPSESIDWSIWHDLPVQSGGRVKPLETHARETLRELTNRSSQIDPRTRESLPPIAWYMTQLLDWSGWTESARQPLSVVTDWRPLYFHLHQPDSWDTLPQLRVEHAGLAQALGLTQGRQIAPHDLAQKRLIDTDTGRELVFTTWVDSLRTSADQGRPLTTYEREALALGERLRDYQYLRMARNLEVLPLKEDPKRQWVPLAYVLLSDFDDAADPTGDYRGIQGLWSKLSVAWRAKDWKTFNALSHEFVNVTRRAGTADGEYPTPAVMAWENAFFRWRPFRWSGVALLIAGLLLVVAMVRDIRGVSFLGRGVYVLAFLALACGFGWRCAFANQTLASSAYELLILASAMVVILGGALACVEKQGAWILCAAALLGAAVIGVAESAPKLFRPEIELQTVFEQGQRWFGAHRVLMASAVAPLTLASIIANVVLLARWRSRDNVSFLEQADRVQLRLTGLGVALVVASIAARSQWADAVWGTPWNWTAQEIWPTVSCLFLMALFQTRLRVSQRWVTMAVLQTCVFLLYLGVWYGVSFMAQEQLYLRGFGTSGEVILLIAASAQLLFALTTLIRSPDWANELASAG